MILNSNSMCWKNSKFYVYFFFFYDIEMPSLERKKCLNIKQSSEFFLHMLKFEIIWTRIGQLLD